jgi:hypothetical protein
MFTRDQKGPVGPISFPRPRTSLEMLEKVPGEEKSPKAEVIRREPENHIHNQSIQDVKDKNYSATKPRLAIYLQSASYANYHLP